MFFEDWNHQDDFGNDHTAAFVFQNFFVIVAEPKLNLQQSFDAFPDVLPIAIPLSSIRDITLECYLNLWYKLHITFGNQSTYTAITGSYDYPSPDNILAENFSFNVNEKLIRGVIRTKTFSEQNQKMIESLLMQLVNGAKNEWDSRRLAIDNIFEDSSIKYILPESFDTCEGGRFSCYIGPDMIMLPCSFDQDRRYEVSLMDMTIEEAWNSKSFDRFRNHMRHSCPECSMRDLCLGGCPLMPEIVFCNKTERTIV